MLVVKIPKFLYFFYIIKQHRKKLKFISFISNTKMIEIHKILIKAPFIYCVEKNLPSLFPVHFYMYIAIVKFLEGGGGCL